MSTEQEKGRACPESVDVLVAGGGGFIGGHLVGDLLSEGLSVRAVDSQAALGTGIRSTADAENIEADLSLLENAIVAALPAPDRSTCSLPTWAAWASSRTTRPLCMLSACSRAPTCSKRPNEPASSGTSTPPPHACTPPASRPTSDVTALQRGRRLSRAARGRLRLGEALHRADVPPLQRGLRPDYSGGPLSQRLRPGWARGTAVARRPRPPCVARSPLASLTRQPRDRDLGRRRADPQLHVHRRLRRRARR